MKIGLPPVLWIEYQFGFLLLATLWFCHFNKFMKQNLPTACSKQLTLTLFIISKYKHEDLFDSMCATV